MYLQKILIVVVGVLFLLIIIKRIVSDLTNPIIEWNGSNKFPTNIREDRNISEDVLIYDLDTEFLCIGYYTYNTDRWIFITSKNQPKNFLWTYLEN